MITAWRLTKQRFAHAAYSGEGARLYGGRWSSPGIAVVYASATASLSVLEVFANVQRSDLLTSFALVACTFDERLVETIASGDLPANWRQSPPPAELKRIGDDWVRGGRSAVLEVPSAILARENNYILNPAHADFRHVRIGEPEDFTFDVRLVERA